MLKYGFDVQLPSVSLKQAISDIIGSIAMEEIAVSNILNAESKIIEKANKFSIDINELAYANTSVDSVIKNVIRLQILFRLELEEVVGFLEERESIDELEE